MEAIEFKSKIKNGIIQIPEKYKKKIGNNVKVIVITEKKVKQTDIIDKLLANPMKSKDFSPFSREEIYEKI
jgi:hypothetical protein